MNYQEIKNKLHGPVFPIVTPFTKTGGLDFDSLKGYLDYLYEGGARNFYVMAYNSRFGVLTDQEIMTLNRVTTEHIKNKDQGCVVIIGDPIHCSTDQSIKFAKEGKEFGADVISLLYKEKVYFDDQIYQHFQAVAAASDIGLLIHEMKLDNGIPGKPPLVHWPLEVLDKISNIPSVVAIKEDAKEDQYTDDVFNLLKDRISIITSGNGKKQWLQFAKKGCHGWLTGTASFDPRIAIKFYEHYNNGNLDKCQEIINKIEIPFDNVKNKYGWHLGIKSAMEAVGVMKRDERMPLIKLPESDHSNIVEAMIEITKDCKTLCY